MEAMMMLLMMISISMTIQMVVLFMEAINSRP